MSRTIALFGHSGTTGKLIVPALAAESSIKLKVFHRPSSDVSALPENVATVKVDYNDIAGLTDAFKGVDIVVSLIGGGIVDQAGFLAQIPIVGAAKAAGVKLFLPSDLAPTYSEEETAAVPVVQAKGKVEQKLEEVGLQHIVVHAASIAEFGLGMPFFGVNVPENTLDVPGAGDENRIEFSSLRYIAAAYAALLTSPDLYSQPSEIGISEFSGTGKDIAAALEKKHGKAPTVTHTSSEDAKAAFQGAASTPGALPTTLRYSWSTRGIINGVKTFEFGGKKSTLDEFVEKL